MSGIRSGLGRFGRILLRNGLQAIPTLLVIIVINFLLLKMAPGDAADVLAAESGFASEESMRALRERLGLDLSLLAQLWNYIAGLVQFDLGQSLRYSQPVFDLITNRLPGTLALMGVSLVLAVALGVLIGATMATYAGRLPDRALSVLSLVFYSVPGFWIGLMLIIVFSVNLGWLPSGGSGEIGSSLTGWAWGLMLIIVFSVNLGWLPSGGSGEIGSSLTGWAWLVDKLRYMILPAISLSMFYVAIYARLTRAAMLEVISQDYIRTARSKGLAPFTVIMKHVLRNALIPVTTMAGLHVGGILGGAVVVETVFNWPGLGRLAFEAVTGRDYNVLLGILLFSSILVIAVNVLVDLLQAWLDPRIAVR